MTAKSKRLLGAALVAFVATGVAQPALAGPETVSRMAGIVLRLEHFPSAEAKAQLTAIADDERTSKAEQQVAMAIRAIEHKVNDADKAKLLAISGDDAQPVSLRMLANIVASMNHIPDDKAKMALERLEGGKRTLKVE